jgi:hypothetical protein
MGSYKLYIISGEISYIFASLWIEVIGGYLS